LGKSLLWVSARGVRERVRECSHYPRARSAMTLFAEPDRSRV
jgi:hypothetical protein